MVNLQTTKSIPFNTYEYIKTHLEKEGALHFSLIDPDPLKQEPMKAGIMAHNAEKAGSDAILIGGSTIFDQIFVEKTITAIKDKVRIPVIIFPGGLSNISEKADAILFMSLLNSTNPYFIIGQQALASFTIKAANLEHISMAYLIIEPGASAGWIGNANLIPRDKPKLTTAYALAAEMYGFKLIYLEAGSGGQKIPIQHVKICSQFLNIPLIVGGGVENKDDAKAFVDAGADIIVMGTHIENNILKDNGSSLKTIINEIKNTGKNRRKKTFT